NCKFMLATSCGDGIYPLLCLSIDGNLKFSLESVKKLKELMDENKVINPRMVVSKAGLSPRGLRLCSPMNSFALSLKQSLFSLTDLVAGDVDLCEICANAACSGCF
uniref:Uncharacterized protein n=1 Tax=Phasianus colchicus TaxID=9054 RepID=A0A669QQR1_PHACC